MAVAAGFVIEELHNDTSIDMFLRRKGRKYDSAGILQSLLALSETDYLRIPKGNKRKLLAERWRKRASELTNRKARRKLSFSF